jgi:hypothetical protein
MDRDHVKFISLTETPTEGHQRNLPGISQSYRGLLAQNYLFAE